MFDHSEILVGDPGRILRTGDEFLRSGPEPAGHLATTTVMVDSAIWIDGSRVRYDLHLGDRIDLRSGSPILVLGYDDRRRRRLFP
jgi:hypothetical protein